MIVAASERAHDRVMKVLEGGSLTDGANVENGEVSLNLLAIIGNGLQSLQDAGLLTRVDLPELDTSADPADQIAQLEDAIGRDLPDDFGQIVIYESEQIAAAQEAVARAQQALVLFRRAIIAILILTVVSLVASFFLATRRRRALVTLALGVVAAMGLGRAVVRTVVQEVPTLALKPGSRRGAQVDGRVARQRADDRGDPRPDRRARGLRDRVPDRLQPDRRWPCGGRVSPPGRPCRRSSPTTGTASRWRRSPSP